MVEFFEALSDPELTFLRYAAFTAVLASVPFGFVGTYVVARRISYIAGAIAHCVLGGIGISLYLRYNFNIMWMSPHLGATIFALVSAILIGLVSVYAREREDTVIGAVWAVGMAIGLLFIAKTPGNIDAMNFLFGNILLVSRTDIILLIGLNILILVIVTVFYNKFRAVCFDDEHLKTRGVNANLYYIAILMMTALTIVFMMRVVGIVLVIALLTLPAAIAGNVTRRLWQMMLLATILSSGFSLSGLGLSYQMDLPTGPTIIVLAGLFYLAVTIIRLPRRRWHKDF